MPPTCQRPTRRCAADRARARRRRAASRARPRRRRAPPLCRAARFALRRPPRSAPAPQRRASDCAARRRACATLRIWSRSPARSATSRLKMALERDVRLVRFEEGGLEFALCSRRFRRVARPTRRAGCRNGPARAGWWRFRARRGAPTLAGAGRSARATRARRGARRSAGAGGARRFSRRRDRRRARRRRARQADPGGDRRRAATEVATAMTLYLCRSRRKTRTL